MSNSAVAILMAVVFCVVVGIDIWLAADGKDGNTYSERIRAWGKRWPPFRAAVLLFLGVLAGHWFW
jgi:hypothetical protein